MNHKWLKPRDLADVTTGRSITSLALELAEDVSKKLVAIIPLLLSISIFSGLFFGVNYNRFFGIDYLQLAEIDDFVRAAFSNIVIIVVVLVYISFGVWWLINFEIDWKNAANFKKKIKAIIKLTFQYIFLIFTIFLSMVPTQSGIRELVENYNGDVTKSGRYGVSKVVYGRNVKSFECLAFVSKTGNFMHYWSVAKQVLITIPLTQIIEINQTVRGKPNESLFGSNSAFEEELQHWLDKIEISCGHEVRNKLEILVK
jgi:hypothetical protein